MNAYFNASVYSHSNLDRNASKNVEIIIPYDSTPNVTRISNNNETVWALLYNLQDVLYTYQILLPHN